MTNPEVPHCLHAVPVEEVCDRPGIDINHALGLQEATLKLYIQSVDGVHCAIAIASSLEKARQRMMLLVQYNPAADVEEFEIEDGFCFGFHSGLVNWITKSRRSQ